MLLNGLQELLCLCHHALVAEVTFLSLQFLMLLADILPQLSRLRGFCPPIKHN